MYLLPSTACLTVYRPNGTKCINLNRIRARHTLCSSGRLARSGDSKMTVFTIGYEGIDIDAFVSLLSEHGIETVVDIRELPLSRKPGFSKRALGNVLNLSGYEYLHMAALGCPKPVRERYRDDSNWARYTEGFLAHLKTQENAIAELAGLVASSNCALMCYEADYNFCHRSLVANAIRDYSSAGIQHIKAKGARTMSPVASARVVFA